MFRRRSHTVTKPSRIVGALDIGTSKVCCLIVGVDRPGTMQLYGFGHQRTHGLKAGVIIDPEPAERAVRAAIGQAESMAGITLERVFVSVTCGRLKSANFVARASLAARAASRGDVARVLAGAEAFTCREGREAVQLIQGGWSLDGAAIAREPIGLEGRELALSMHAVTADAAPLRNLLNVVERCYLDVEGTVAAPFASALAATTEEERRLGVLCIDFGGGTTTLSMFVDGRSAFVEGVPVGGCHISYDIARALSTPLAEAERIKTLYGTLVPAQSDEREIVSFPSADSDQEEFCQTTKSELRAIIEPRIRALRGLVVERLAQSGLEHVVADRLVMTGGASQLVGLAEWWSSQGGPAVRVGRPQASEGMPAGMCNPAFSTAAGLVLASLSPEVGAATGRELPAAMANGYFGRLHGWIRDSF